MVDPWKIIKYPLLTEKAIAGIERNNRMIFIVDRRARKPEIKWAIEKSLGVKVVGINTQIDQKGRKKAYVKLSKEFLATDIATKFGML